MTGFKWANPGCKDNPGCKCASTVVTSCAASTWPSTLYLTTGGQTVTLHGGASGGGSYGWTSSTRYPSPGKTQDYLHLDCLTFDDYCTASFVLTCDSGVVSLLYQIGSTLCATYYGPFIGYGAPYTAYFMSQGYSSQGPIFLARATFNALTTSGSTVTGSGSWSGWTHAAYVPPRVPTNDLSPPVWGAFGLSS
jgi:hypothetical protein